MSLLPFGATAQTYEALWKAEQRHETEGKPQSAYKVTQQILQKALREGHKGQAMSARMCAAGLHQEWAPDSFFTDVAQLEALRKAEPAAEARAVYASILAQVYQNNRHRSQASGLELTSTDMKEWTVEQYDSAALANWHQSLADIPALAQARSKDWLPFMAQATSSRHFGHDLLHILWQRMRDQRHRTWGQDEMQLVNYAKAVRDEYARRGNREATLLMELDLAELERDAEASSPFKTVRSDDDNVQVRDTALIARLTALAQRYADLPLCTEIYMKLLDTDAPDSLKATWAEYALKHYPRYERIGQVQNQLNNLRQPHIQWEGNNTCYPGKAYVWHLRAKNATGINAEVLRLPADFKHEELHRQLKDIPAYLRKRGTAIQKIAHSIGKNSPYKEIEDSIAWTAPSVGVYAVLFTATTAETEATQRTVNQHYQLIQVSALATIHFTENDGVTELVVVDAESGHPVEGATVQCYERSHRDNSLKLFDTQHTDAEGRSRFRLDSQNRSYSFKVSKADDCWAPDVDIWGGYQRERAEQTRHEVRLYTDRAIYRPGQTVRLSGLLYSQKHWDAQVVAGQKFTLTMRDANNKEVAQQTVSTDSMGVFAADFVLPDGGLPGQYTIQESGSHHMVSFRVEEYKRPTFEVKMDQAPALQWPQDSITLTGKAEGYNGVPVRGGRVTAHYQFSYPYWWWFRHDDSPRMPADTVWTDETGAFAVQVPLKDIPAEALTYGLRLTLDAEVLSAVGETREGHIDVPLCTTPLRLQLTMNEQQDRERLKKPAFALLSSTEKPTAGTVTWRIVPAGADDGTPATAEGTFSQPATPTGKETDALAEAIRRLPSGQYELRAVAKAGQDTASAKAPFYVFGMSDTQLPCPKNEWFYCPDASFDAQHPARIQVGSSFDDVVIYYRLESHKGTVENRIVRLSNQLQTLEIPYRPEYADGVEASFAFVKHGTSYSWNQTLRLRQPSSQLKWEWTTFRDHTHPGEQQTWTLRLTRPDGTPAPANLMATIYDASLDQLVAHQWNLSVNRFHKIPFRMWYVFCPFMERRQIAFYFPMKSLKVPALTFDKIDEKWTSGMSFGLGYGLRGRIAGLQTISKKRLMMTGANAPARATMANADALYAVEESAEMEEPMLMAAQAKGIGGSVELSEPDIEQLSPKAGAPVAALRTNFNETAAFMPRLHTNPHTGEVTLSFTLPESLTTWQLLGIAHTPDMQTACIQAQTTARKELMASLHLPRFLRASDQGNIRATVQNLTDQPLSGTALLEVFDPETERLILRQEAPFATTAQGETVLSFAYTPTEQYPIVAVRLTATTGSTKSIATKGRATKNRKRKADADADDNNGTTVFTDGEQRYLPILSAQTWVTESVEIQADSTGTYTTDLSTLFNKDNPSATHRRLTVEYTTHPIWNVVQALPALREAQHDDVLSLTAVCYANTLAAHIAATAPRLKDIVGLWKQQANAASGANTSPLARNEELKQLILDETPWLREAQTDAERRAQLIDLFDPNLVEQRIGTSFQRLAQRQEDDGGFAWFPGMRSSELMTRLVAIELTHLRALTSDFSTLSEDAAQQANQLLQQAFAFLAKQVAHDVADMRKAEAKGTTISTASLMHLNYVYITQQAGVRLNRSQQADVRYLLDHLKGSVAGMSNSERAMAAIVLKADGRQQEARLYYDALREHATSTQAHGTFFDYAGGSFTPTAHKIIVHTTAMEAAEAMEGAQTPLMRGMRRWLLQQKRTQMWESSICTTNAIYALLHGAEAELNASGKDRLTLDYGRSRTVVEPSAADGRTRDTQASPAALGYIRQTYTDGRAPRAITVQRHTPTEAWGAVYAQYLTPIADASTQAAGLGIRCELSNTTPTVGDKFTTRYIITADRDYEYVCLSADRPAAAEPAEQVSGYHYQGGLGYYRAVRDARTDYFFDRLPKGTYVLEETAFIDRSGRYSTGLCRIQCLYAPEYEGHTGGKSVEIKDKR